MALATLSIDLEARLAQLQAGLDKAGRLAEKNAAQIEATFGKLNAVAGTVGAALGGAFAGVSVVGFIKSTNDALDALNDVADATGATIENLSALEDVARRNGGTLDQVSGILVKFNGVLKEADGKNGVSQALAAINLNAEELRRLDPAEALRRTAAALAGISDDGNGNKARIVQELFGKSIKEAAPFLKDLAEQGQLYATVTAEQARQAEAFNKQLFAFQTNASNAGRAIVSDLVPALNAFFDRTRGIDDTAQKFSTLGQVILTPLEAISVFALNVQYVLRGIGTELGGIAAQGAAVARLDFKAVAAIRQQMLEDSARARVEIDAMSKRLLGGNALPQADYSNEGRRFAQVPALAALTGASAPKPRGVAARSEFVGPLVDDTRLEALRRLENTDTSKIAALNAELSQLMALQSSGTQGDFVGAIESVRKELDALDPSAKAAAESAARLKEMLSGTPTAQIEVARKDMLLLADALEQGKINAEQFVEAAQTRLGTLPEEVKPAFDQITEFTKQFERNVQDAMGATVLATLRGDFDNIGRLWGDLLLKMAAEAVAADLGNKLFPPSGSDGGKNIFGRILGLFGFAKGGAFAGGVPIKAFASGGVVGAPTLFGMRGGLGLMGEAGPEAVMPLKRGRDGKLGVASQGGGGVTIVNQVAAGVQRGELLAALQLSSQATEARLVSLLRTRGVL